MPAQTVTDIDTSPLVAQLLLLKASTSTVFSGTRMQKQKTPYGLNREVYTTWGATPVGQGVKGSGEVLIGEHTYYMDVTGYGYALRKELTTALSTMTAIEYDGVKQLAKGIRIESEDYYATGAVVGIVVAPAVPDNTSETGYGI